MGLKLSYMGLKVTYMGLKLSYMGLNLTYMGLKLSYTRSSGEIYRYLVNTIGKFGLTTVYTYKSTLSLSLKHIDTFHRNNELKCPQKNILSRTITAEHFEQRILSRTF